MSLFSSRHSCVRSVLPVLALACVALTGCMKFPSPGAATPPLTKNQSADLAKCQQAINKAQSSFAKTQLSTLQKCLDGVLKVTVPFDNGVTAQEDYDAGIAKAAEKCTKGYDKIGAASTKLVDAIVKSCEPVADLVLGSYDGLRFALGGVGGAPSIEMLAGGICGATEALVDAQAFVGTPRMMELLASLGSEFVIESDDMSGSGFPNLPLDPRCPPIDVIGSFPPGFPGFPPI